MTDKEATKEESGQNIGSSLFSKDDNDDSGEMVNFAEQFMDKVRAIHEHFDKDKDGFLNFQELSSLQLYTSGQALDGTMYGYICQAFGSQPSKGLSLNELKLTYAAEGTNAGEFFLIEFYVLCNVEL